MHPNGAGDRWVGGWQRERDFPLSVEPAEGGVRRVDVELHPRSLEILT